MSPGTARCRHRLLAPKVDDLDAAFVAEEHGDEEAERAVDERGEKGDPKAGYIESLYHRRGHLQEQRVDHEDEKAGRHDRERKREQDEDRPEERVEHAEDYPGEDERKHAVHFDAVEHLCDERQQQQVYDESSYESFHLIISWALAPD